MCSNISTETTRSKRSSEVEVVHVGGDDPQVDEAARRGLLLDEGALRGRVGDRGDPRLRIALGHPQRQRTPAAAELEDRPARRRGRRAPPSASAPSLPPSPGYRRGRRRAAGILPLRAEDVLEEGGRHLVVLGVGRVGVFGDGACRHLAREPRSHRRIGAGEPASRCADQR